MSDGDRIEQLTADISANRVPGGSAFARAAAELIALRVAQLPSTSTLTEVRLTVADVSDWAASTKPSMAVVRNVAELARSVSATGTALSANELKVAIDAAMRGYIARSEAAVAALPDHAGEVFREGTTILVHSYSASLEALLRKAAATGIEFRLSVTESRPYRESRRLIEAIAESPIEIVLYSDAAVSVAAASADLALIGADSVFTDGSFANKTGSLPLALSCREMNVPVYVATELSKVYLGDISDIEMELRPAAELSEGWSLVESGRVKVCNQFFERVDAQLVHRYITEIGLLSTDEICAAAASSWQPKSIDGQDDRTATVGSQ
jgi:translation initiation factor 2B subunit (eIF-2B alpha/beta/delta family)